MPKRQQYPRAPGRDPRHQRVNDAAARAPTIGGLRAHRYGTIERKHVAAGTSCLIATSGASPLQKRCQNQRMQVKAITFVGTRAPDQPAMSSFVRDVLGLRPLNVEGAEADFFTLPDGTTFAVSSTGDADRPERTVGFLVDDVEDAARELRDAGLTTDDVSTTDVHRYIHFRAPDGRLYELVEQLHPHT